MVTKAIDLMKELDTILVHRRWEIEGLVLGLFTGYPTFWLGPIGIGKTYAIDRLVAMIKGAKLFRLMLTKHTEPEELFGPFNFKKLRKGVYERIITDKLPDADVAYLDEPFKASSAIINSLLDILLYQRFYDGSKYVRTHILALYLSANEEPRLYEQLTFFDRSAIRIISQHLGWEEMIDVLGTPQRAIDSMPKVISKDEIEEAQREVVEVERSIMNNSELKTAIIKVVNQSISKVAEQGEVLEVSERRLMMVRRVVATIAWAYEEEPNLDHVAMACLFTLPTSQTTYATVKAVISAQLSNSSVAYKDKLDTVKAEIINAKTDEDKAKLQGKLAELQQQAPRRFFLGTI